MMISEIKTKHLAQPTVLAFILTVKMSTLEPQDVNVQGPGTRTDQEIPAQIMIFGMIGGNPTTRNFKIDMEHIQVMIAGKTIVAMTETGILITNIGVMRMPGNLSMMPLTTPLTTRSLVQIKVSTGADAYRLLHNNMVVKIVQAIHTQEI